MLIKGCEGGTIIHACTVLQSSLQRPSIDESSEYMDFEKLWEINHKSDGSQDLPKFGASDFKFVSVLGKGSFGKVCDVIAYAT